MATYFVEVGLLLLIIPWSAFWDRNWLLEAVPAVHAFTRSPYVRGAVSGLGAVNLGAGVLEVWGAWVARRRNQAPAAAQASVPPEGPS